MGQTKGKDTEEGLEGLAQQVTGSGDELRGRKQLRGRREGGGSRKQPKGAETPGRPGECTGTDAAGERVKGGKVEQKTVLICGCQNTNMGKGQQQRGEGGAAPATEMQSALVQEGTREVVEVWEEPITEEWKQWTTGQHTGRAPATQPGPDPAH